MELGPVNVNMLASTLKNRAMTIGDFIVLKGMLGGSPRPKCDARPLENLP